jgi:long-chain fatty acid transport protein
MSALEPGSRPRRVAAVYRFAAAVLLAAACPPPPLAAQTNLETNAGVYFNFSTPGAGNLGLGGAFLALAFDASAAYTNPAGLTTIAAPEALVEARHWTFTHVYTDHGRIAGQEPQEMGEDTIRGLRDGEADDEVTGLSFFSYVHPYRDWSFALYRHEVVNFEASFDTFGAYLERTRRRSFRGIPGERDARLAALRNRMDLDIVAYGGAAAFRPWRGLSLGIAVSYFDFAIDSQADRYLPDLLERPCFAVDPARGCPEANPLLNAQSQQGEDTDWGFAGGLLWESRQKRWSAGAVYRQGPDFTFRARSQSRTGTVFAFTSDKQAAFHVPDVYGVGLAFRPSDAWRFAVDYDRVRYSQLTEGFVDIFDLATLLPGEAPELDAFRIDDAGEIHVGAEYALLQRWPVLMLRAGAWYEPDHSLRFEGRNVGFSAVFRPRGDEMHYTAGVGLALHRLLVDLAADHSRRVDVISLSVGFRP